MRTSPSWSEVYGGSLPDTLPPVPRLDVPYVAAPTCADHCSGRHDHDGDVLCDHCRVPAYQVWQHEWRGRPGVYFSVLQPVNGAPPYIPGKMTHMTCPACGHSLRRT